MPSGGPFRAQEVKRKNIVCTNETRKRENITSSLAKGNEVGVVLKPKIGASGSVNPVA